MVRSVVVSLFVVCLFSCHHGAATSPVDRGEAVVEALPVTRPPSAPPGKSRKEVRAPTVTGHAATMTTPRGDRLEMVSLDVEVTVVGRLARTQVKQVFDNPTKRRVEGIYDFRLPRDASISRLAMDVEGKLVEGEIVERKAARKIYDDIVRKQKDPALLEWQADNRFTTSIFPIEPQSTKTVIVAYEQILPARGRDARYVYQLPALREARRRSVPMRLTATAMDAELLRVDGTTTNRLTLGELAGTGQDVSLNVLLPEEPAQVHWTRTGAGPVFVADLALPVGRSRQVHGLVIAVDTSASMRGRPLAQAKDLARDLVATAGEDLELVVIVGDLATRRCRSAPASTADERRELLRCIDGLDAAGASDLSALMADAARVPIAEPAAALLISDGGATLGEIDVTRLPSTYAPGGDRSLHTAAVGHHPDEGLLRLLAGHGGGAVHREPDAGAVLARLNETGMTDVELVVVQGVVRELVGPGYSAVGSRERLSVTGRLASPRATLEVRARRRGELIRKTVKLTPPPGAGASTSALADRSRGLLARFWARRWISTLEARPTDEQRDDIVKMSINHGVMSRHTSFLVLESAKAFDDRGIVRRKHEDALRHARKRPDVGNLQDLFGNTASLSPADERFTPEPTRSAGSPVMAKRMKRVPKIRVGRAVVMGSLDRSLIRRVIRANQSRFRHCYDLALQRDPKALGRHTTQFSIDTHGRVIAVRAKDSELDVAFAQCMNRAYSALRFPAVRGGGHVTVSYPMVFANPAALAAANEARIDELLDISRVRRTPEEYGELIHLLLVTGRTGDAEDTVAYYEERLDKEKRKAADLLHVLTTAKSRTHFAERFINLATPLVTRDGHHQFAEPLWNLYRDQGFLQGAARLFATSPPTRPLAQLILVDLDRLGEHELGEELVRRWDDDRIYGDDELFGMVRVASDRLTRSYVERKMRRGVANTTMLIVWLDRTGGLESRDVRTRLASYCAQHIELFTFCDGRLDPWRGDLATAVFYDDYEAHRVAHLRWQRQQDYGNPDLIVALAEIREKEAGTSAGLRLLSELVEFNPVSADVWVRYAKELYQRKLSAKACAALGTATQLDPTRRDLFVEMMAMQKSRVLTAPAGLSGCVVDAIERLPVPRDITVVLTWDDPATDLDLHVHEPEGAHVSYENLVSKSGGFLYNDVTRGYGPEVYTRSKARGAFRISIVHYEGEADVVSATLTVIYDGGTDRARRETHQVALSAGERRRPVPVTTVKIR